MVGELSGDQSRPPSTGGVPQVAFAQQMKIIPVLLAVNVLSVDFASYV